MPATVHRKPPRAGMGRPKGSPNKVTTTLKEAILLAAGKAGLDGKGKDGLTGYLLGLALNDTKSFATLLGRVLPLEVTGEGGGAFTVVVKQFTIGGK